MTNDYINEHFGMERAQFERDTAALLFKGGNIGCETSMNARNVKSEHEPGKQLVAFTFKCLSKEQTSCIQYIWYLRTKKEVTISHRHAHVVHARTVPSFVLICFPSFISCEPFKRAGAIRHNSRFRS